MYITETIFDMHFLREYIFDGRFDLLVEMISTKIPVSSLCWAGSNLVPAHDSKSAV